MIGLVKPILRWSLGQKLSATLCVVVFGVAVLISFLVIAEAERALDSELQKRGVNIVQNLARLSAEPVLQDDLWGLYKVVRDIVQGGPGSLSENVVVYAMVVGPRREVLTHSDPARFPIAESLPPDPVSDAALGAEGLLIQVSHGADGKPLYDVAYPVVVDRQRLAVARIGLTRDYLEQSLARIKRDVFLIAALLAALGVVLGLVISRRITRPLKRLSASVQALSQGRLDERIHVETREKDEVGLLADSFNQMAENLRGKVREIQATKQYLENLLENANDFIWTLDLDGRITYVNRKFTELGYEKGELLGRPASTLIPALHDERAAGSGEGTFELQLRDKAGGTRLVVVTASLLTDDAGGVIGTLGLAKDITERRELEQRLRRSEKLASIGEMAGAVAHEIRNPLSSIYTAVNLLSLSPGSSVGEEQMALFRSIREESRRLNRILTDFLRFARPRSPLFQPHDLNILVEEVLETLRHDESARGKVITKALAPRLSPVRADADQMKQVLWNVVLNSLQAVGKAGVVAVTTALEDGRAKIRVNDNGPGIPPDALARLFEPFSSTKRDGVGLGLAIAHRIVEAHGGRIEVESNGDGGTAVEISLPVHQG